MFTNKYLRYLLLIKRSLFCTTFCFLSLSFVVFPNAVIHSEEQTLEYFQTPSEHELRRYVLCEKTKEPYLYIYNEKLDAFKPLDLKNTSDKVKKVALIVYPSSDHNGAFQHRFSDHMFKKVHKDLTVLLARPSCIHKMHLAIQDTQKLFGNIHCLWIKGHGQKNYIKITDKEFFTYKSLNKETVALLDPEAKIFLDSCHTGKSGGLAQKLSRITEKRCVYAPKNTSYGKLNDYKDGEIKFSTTYKRKNITACYQNGVYLS